MKQYLLAVLLTAGAAVLSACTPSPEVLPAPETEVEIESEAEAETEAVTEAEPEIKAEADTVPENIEEPEAEDTVESAAWKDTFAAALWIYASGEQYTPECRFSLAYIDADDIPELLIHRGNGHASGVEIYAYLDGGLINVSTEYTPNEFGAYGSLGYSEKGGRFTSSYRAMGEHTCDVYAFDDRGSAVLTRSFCDNEDSGEDTVVYRINGEDVSADAYHAALDEAEAGLTVADYENAYEFTSENYVALF